MTHQDPRGDAPGRHRSSQELAAFLDGRLEASAREAVLAHLASCEDCFELVSDVVSFQSEDGESEMEEVRGGSELIRPASDRKGFLQHYRPWRRLVVSTTGLVAAAALLLLVVAPQMGWRTRALPRSGELVAAVPAEPFRGDRLAAEISGHGWPETLGQHSFATAEQIAFRLGVRSVEIEMALRAGDTSSAVRLTHLVERLSSALREGPFVASLYAEPGLRGEILRGASRDVLLRRHHEVEELLVEPSPAGGTYLDPFWASFGKWAQAARFAALAGADEHFRSPAHLHFLERLRTVDLPSELEESWRHVDRLLAEERPSEQALADALAVLIRRAGGG